MKNPRFTERPRGNKLRLCNVCGKLIKSHRFSYHVKSHEFGCDHCFANFKTEKLLNEHLEEHSTALQYCCDVCNLKFKTVLKLALHKYSHNQQYVCPICDFVASSKTSSSIRSHILRHEDNFKFRCEQCGKGFLNASTLADHLDMHSGLRKYECELCHKKFTTKSYLKLHIKFNHKKEVYGIEERFQCDLCGKNFTFEKSFIRHLSTIHKIGRDLRVKCQICSKTIANSFNLKKHMRIHTGEKNFACDTCGKKFSDMKYVRKHQSVHLREMGLLKTRRAPRPLQHNQGRAQCKTEPVKRRSSDQTIPKNDIVFLSIKDEKC